MLLDHIAVVAQFTVEPLQKSEIKAFINLRKQLFQETPWLKFDPGEEEYSEKIESNIYENFILRENSTILIAKDGKDMVGYVVAIGGISRKSRHAVHLAIAILEQHQYKGLGKSMMDSLQAWAKSVSVHRLELVVAIPNKSAQKFFYKHGFKEEGVKHHATFYSGEYVNQLCLYMLI